MRGNVFVSPVFPLQLFCKKLIVEKLKERKNTVNECIGNKKILDISYSKCA